MEDIKITVTGNEEAMRVRYSTKPEDMPDIKYFEFLSAELGYALANLCMIRSNGNKGVAIAMAEQALAGTKKIIASDVLDGVELKKVRRRKANGRTGQDKGSKD